MTEEEIFAKVQEIAAEELDVDKAKITLTTNIKDDLDADSLDLFEIMSELEDEFEIELEADEDITTVEDVVKYVKKELNAKD